MAYVLAKHLEVPFNLEATPMSLSKYQSASREAYGATALFTKLTLTPNNLTF